MMSKIEIWLKLKGSRFKPNKKNQTKLIEKARRSLSYLLNVMSHVVANSMAILDQFRPSSSLPNWCLVKIRDVIWQEPYDIPYVENRYVF